MRILFLIDDLYLPEIYAGTGLHTHHLALELQRRGHFVAALARHDGETSRQPFDGLGYPLYRGPDVIALARYLKRHGKFDVAINQNRGLWRIIDPLDYDDGPLEVFYEHTLLFRARIAAPPIRSRSLCLVNSDLLARHYQRTYGIGSIVVPPLCGIEPAAPARGEHATMVAIQHGKGTDIVAELARRRADVRFVVVETWSNDSAEAIALKNRLLGLPNVTVLANRHDIGNILASTRLLLMPSRVPETWGRIVTEAQMRSIAALASDRGSLPQTVGPGGVTLDPDGPLEPWAQEFDALWNDSDRLARVGEAGRAHAHTLLAGMEAAIDRFELLISTAAPQATAGLADRRSARAPSGSPAVGSPFLIVSDHGMDAWQRAIAEDTQAPLWRIARDFAAPVDQRIVARIARTCGFGDQQDCHQLAYRLAIHEAESRLQCIGGLDAMSRRADFAFVGRRRIEEALAGGRGLVLLAGPTAFARTIAPLALQAAGYPIHRFDNRAVDAQRLPPGATPVALCYERFEARLIAGRIGVGDQRASAVRACLAGNGIILGEPVPAAASDVYRHRMIGGELPIDGELVELALQNGAALLPLSVTRLAGRQRFELRLSEAIVPQQGADPATAVRAACASLAASFLQDMVRYPEQWLGWHHMLDDSAS